MPAEAASPVESLSYEDAREELVRVVQELESGGASLEQSLALWERGNALADRCEEWLQGAKARLDAARSGAGAEVGAGSDTGGADAAGDYVDGRDRG